MEIVYASLFALLYVRTICRSIDELEAFVLELVNTLYHPVVEHEA